MRVVSFGFAVASEIGHADLRYERVFVSSLFYKAKC